MSGVKESKVQSPKSKVDRTEGRYVVRELVLIGASIRQPGTILELFHTRERDELLRDGKISLVTGKAA